MKKTLIFICFVLVVLLSGCNKNEFDKFKKAIDSINNETIYGLSYEKIQMSNGVEVYKQNINSQIISYSSSKAKLEFSEKKLATFPSDEQYDKIDYMKYYNGSNVTIVTDEETTSVSEVLKELKINFDLSKIMEQKNINYTIEGSNLNINVDDDTIKSIFNIENVDSMRVVLTLEESKIVYIKLLYSISNSDFSIIYKLSYTAYDESILQIPE